ncbi:MAG: hypothetical protein ACRD21_25525 [Vicinamibacteria bacterium]
MRIFSPRPVAVTVERFKLSFQAPLRPVIALIPRLLLVGRPVQSLLGVLVVALRAPAYFVLRRANVLKTARPARAEKRMRADRSP